MKIGIISEGHSDRAVISNIVTGVTGLDISDIEALRPIYTMDETDKARKDPRSFSSWSVVREECKNRELIDTFLSIEGQDFIIIHLDSAECADYGVQRTNDKLKLRDLIVNQINNWFSEDLSKSILYAIAIEEIDSWVLTLYEKNDSTNSARPKEKLRRVLGKHGIDSTQTYDNYLVLSKTFSKTKEIKKGNYLSYNHSLAAFCEEIELKVVPKLKTKEE